MILIAQDVVTDQEIAEDRERDTPNETGLRTGCEDGVGNETTVTGEMIPMTIIGIQNAVGTLLTQGRETEVMIVAGKLLIEHRILARKM